MKLSLRRADILLYSLYKKLIKSAFSLRIHFIFSVIFLFSLFSTVNAATRFSVAAGGNWSSTATWSATSGGAGGATVPGSGDDVTIQGKAVTVDAAENANSITVNASDTLIVNNSIVITNKGSVTINGALIFNSTATFSGGGGGSNSVPITVNSGAILSTANTGGFVASSTTTGSIRVNGTTTYNTGINFVYTGATNQTTGTAYTANNPATLTINGATTDTVTLSAASTITGLLTMTSGVLNMANTNLSMGSVTGATNITNSTGTAGARTITIGTDNTSQAVYSGVISNGTATSVAVTKSGTGTLILSGASTYTGSTTITGGTVRVNTDVVTSSNSPLGNSASAVILNGGTIEVNTTNFSRGLSLTANSRIDAYGSNRTVSAAISATGTFILTVGGTTASGAAGQNLTLSGVISNGTTTLALTKDLISKVILTNVNTYTGTTTLTAGELRLNPSANVSMSDTLKFNGGTLGDSGIAASRKITFAAIALANNSNLDLSTANVDTIKFTALGTLTAAKTLTIYGWQGTNGIAGTKGQVFITSSASLTGPQLAQISFNTGTISSPGGTVNATQLSTGEVVPVAPVISSSGTLSALSTTYGTPSTTTTFSVSGTNMGAGITVTAPLGFQVSTVSNFASNAGTSITVGSAGTITSTAVYVRLADTTDVGTKSGNILLSSSGASNVNVATVSSTVSQKALTALGSLSVPSSKVYDGTTTATPTGSAALQTAEASGSGSGDGKPYTGDDVSLTGTAAYNYNTKDVATATTVTESGLSLTGAKSGDYTLAAPIFTSRTITPKALTAQGTLSISSKVYDGTTAASPSGSAALQSAESTGSGTTSDGIPYSGDAVSLTGTASYSYNSKDVASATTVTASGLSITGAQSSNYSFTSPGLSATITTKTLTAQGSLALTSKVYDGTTTASPTGAAALQTAESTGSGTTGDGKPYSGDAVSLTGSAAYNFNSKDVSAATTVTESGLSLTGAQNSNYTLTAPTLSATITAKALTAIGSLVMPSSKVYDGGTTATPTSGAAALQSTESGGSGTTADGKPYSGDAVSLTGAAAYNYNTKDVATATTVTESGLSLTGAQNSNYSLTAPTFSATITGLALTVTGVTGNNKVYDRTTSATINTGSAGLSGVVAGDIGNVSLVTGSATGVFVSFNVGTAVTITTSGFSISGSASGNYTLTQPSTSADITAKGLTITGVTGNNKVYDGNTTATLNTGSAALSGVISGDIGNVSINAASATGAFADSNVANGIAITTSGFALTGSAAGNYSVTQPSTSANITAKGLTVTGLTGNNKTYDQTTAATFSGTAALSGVITADLANVSIGGSPSASFISATAGNGKTINVTGYSISGSASGNYSLTQPTLTANITQLALTTTGATAQSKTYDGTTAAIITGESLVGVISPDAVTVSGGGTFASSAVGTGISVTAALVLHGADSANYSLTQPTGLAADINGITITVIGATANNKAYDGNTTATLNTGSAALSGVPPADASNVSLVVSGATGTFASVNVANGITVTTSGFTLSGSSAANYTLTQPTLSANITAKALTVTGLTGDNKVYDRGTSATFSGTAALSGVVSGEELNVVLGGTPSASFATATVGTGKTITVSGYTISGSASGNYSLTQPGLTGNITQLPLTTTGATANNKAYDRTTAATITGESLVGVISGDAVTVGGGGTFASANIGTGIAVTAALTLGGADAGNYSITQPTGLTANITSITLTITGVTANNKTYDRLTTGTLNTGSAALSGIVSGDAGNVTLSSTSATGTFASFNVANGIAVTASGFTISGTSSGNYTLTQPTGLTANITTLALTTTGATASNKTYDGTTAAIITGESLVGVISPDAVTVSGGGTFSSASAGSAKAVTAALTLGGADAGNYTVTQPTGLTANITAKALTVSGITASNKVYDGTTTATLGGTAALQSSETAGTGTTADGKPYTGDVVTIAGAASGTFASKDVANGIAITVTGSTLSGAQAGNYTITQQTGLTGNITAKALNVSGITASNKVYDGTTTATLGGTAALLSSEAAGAGTTADGKPYTGDVVTIGGAASGTFASKDVANGIAITITGNTISGAQSGNYTLGQQTGLTANITAKALTMSGLTGNNKIYDATTTATLGGTAALQSAETAGTGTTADGKPYSGDVVTIGGSASGTFASKNVANGIAITVTGNTLSGAQAGDYTITQQTGLTGNITAKALTVSGITASNKIYDGTTTVTLGGTAALQSAEAAGAGTTADGKPYTGDVVTIGGSPAGTFASKDAANGIAITITGNSISGAQSTNYSITQQTGLTANITPKALTVSGITASNKVYDGTTTATLGGTAALLSAETAGTGTTADGKPYTGDVVTTGGAASGTFASKNVATGIAVTITGNTLSGAQGGNYTITQQTGLTANITALAIQLSGTRAYDGTTTAASTDLTISNNQDGGNLTLSGLGLLASKNVGTRAISAQATPARVNSASGNGGPNAVTTFSVTVSAPTIGNTMVAVVSMRSNTTVSSITQSGVTWTLAAQATGVNSSTEIWYAPVSSTAGTVVTINHGSTRSAAVVMEYSGILTASPLDVTATNTGTSTTPSTGTTAATGQANELLIGGISLANSTFALTSITNSFDTVATSASTFGTAGSNTRVFALEKFTSVTGAVTTGGTTTNVTWSGAVATFKATLQSGSPFALSGSAAGNYTLTGLSGSMIITAKALTTSGATASNKPYDGTTAATITGESLVGVISPDVVTVSGGGTFASPNVSNGIAVTAALTLGGADAGNYSLTQPTGLTANITGTALTITGVTANDKTYDKTTSATLNTGSAALSGVSSGDAGNVTLNSGSATGSFASANVASGISVTTSGFTISGSAAGNYTLTQPTLTANITAKALTVSGITAGNKIYNGTTTATLGGTAALQSAETAGAGTTSDGKPYTGDVVNIGGTAAGTFASKDVANGIAITITGNTISGAQSGNYTITQQTGLTANITAKALTVSGITASNKVYDGTTTATLGGTAALLSAEAAGAGTTADGKPYTGDVVTIGGSASGTFASKDVANGIAITITGNTISGAQSGNYTLGQQTGLTANITAKALTVSGITASNKIYDATTTATLGGTAALQSSEAAGTGTTADGIPYTGDVVTIGGSASGTFASKNVANGIAITITGSSLSGAQAGNYTVTQQTGLTGNITAKSLTVSGITASNKIYDGTTTVTLGGTAALQSAEAAGAGTTADGKPYTGDVVIVGGSPAGTFASKDAANGIAITITGNTISGAQSANYSITQQTGLTANITPKSLTVSGITASNKVYDGTTTATLGGTGALLTAEAAGAGTTADGKPYTGDVVTIGGSPSGSFASKNVANGIAVTINGNTLSGAQGGNYTITQQAGLTANITAKALTVSGITASNKIYNGTTTTTLGGTAALQSAEAAGTGTTADGIPYTGDVVIIAGTASGTFASKDVANGIAITITGNTLSGAQATNYSITQQTGLTANITPKALTVSGITASNRVYDGTTTTTLGGTAALQAAEAAGAGTTADGKPYTGDVVTIGGSPSGTFASKDAASGIAITITGNTLGGAQAGDYTITQQTGLTANITAKALTVSGITASNKAYDGTTAATLGGTAALQSAEAAGAGTTADGKPYTGDVVTIGGTPSGTFASKNVANGIAVTVTGNTLGGAQAGDYTITQQTGLTANITSMSLTITANGVSKTYGTTISSPGAGQTTFTSSGLQNGETIGTVTIAYGTGAAATAAVGTYATVTPSAATGGTFTAGNYSITYSNGNITVGVASLTITANIQIKCFGTTFTFAGTEFTTSGLLNSDAVSSVTLTSAGATSSATVAGSPYSIVPSAATGTGISNYTITYVNNTMAVFPLPSVSISRSPAEICSGQSSTLTATNSGGAGSEVFTGSASPSLSVPQGVDSAYNYSTITLSTNDALHLSSADVIKVSVSLSLATQKDVDVFLVDPSASGGMVIFKKQGDNSNDINTTLRTDTTNAISNPVGAGPYKTQGSITTAPDRTGAIGGTYNALVPANSLNGVPIDGAWSLRVFENNSNIPITLNSWSLTITKNSSYTDVFSGPATIGSVSYSGNGNTTGTASVTPPLGTNTYSVITTDGWGCSSSQATTTVIVDTLPIAKTPAGATTICSGTSANITIASSEVGVNYQLRNNTGNTNVGSAVAGTGGTINLPTGNISSTTTYNVLATKTTSSCTSQMPGTVTITVNPLPTATISGTIAVCLNSSSPNITFTGASATAPYTFTYKINGGSNQTVATTAGNSVTVAVPTTASGTFTYSLVSVQESSSTACSQAQSGSATVTVNTLPTATINGTASACQNSSSPNITFTGANGTAPYTFTYKINGGSNLVTSTTSGNSKTVAAPTTAAGTFTYSLVSVQDANTCSQTQSGSATVTVNPQPTATISGTTTICQNATSPNITFTGANATAPYTFTYKINGGSNQTVNTTSGNSVTVAAPTSTAGTFSYTLVSVQESSSLTCSQAQSGTAVITVNALPSTPIVTVANNCASSNLSTTVTGALLWSTGATTSAITVTAANTYSVTQTDGNSCTSLNGTGTSAPKTIPSAPSVSDVDNCGNSVLSTSATGTLAWSTGATTSSITVTTAGTYSVTQTVSGCISPNGTGTATPITPCNLSYPSPNTFTAGTAITNLNPTVTGAVTSYSVTPTLPAGLSLNTSTGVISGTPTTTTATATYTVTATNSIGSTTTAGVVITVVPGALSNFLVEQSASGGGNIGTQTAGTPFNIQITARDANGNTVTSFTSTVTLSTNASSGTISPTTSSSFVNGVLSSQSVTVTQATSQAITATNGSAGTSNTFNVNGNTFSKLQIILPGETAAPGSATGKTGTASVFNTATPATITVNAVDANWNFVSTASDNIQITATDGSAVLPSNAALSSGTQGFSITLYTVPTQSITATDVTNGSIASSTAVATVSATKITTATGGNWNAGATWVGGVAPLSTDDAIIAAGATADVTANATINSVTFNNISSSTGTLTVDTLVTLTVTTSITAQNGTNMNTNAVIAGSGTVNAASVTAGGVTPVATGNTSTLASSLANFNISGNLNITGYDGTGAQNEPTFDLQSGTITLGGTVAMSEGGTIHSANGITTFTTATTSTPKFLILSGTTPFTPSNSFTINLSGTKATVSYTGPNQIVYPTTYFNINLSGSSTKGLSAGTQVNSVMTINGTAMADIENLLNIAVVDRLWLGGFAQAIGTWGSGTANKQHIDDTWFTQTTGYLTIASAGAATTISNVTASQTICQGTSSVTLSGNVIGANSLYPAIGERVTVTVDAAVLSTTISDNTGGFTINFPVDTITAPGSPYVIKYYYVGNDTLNPSVNTSTALTVNAKSSDPTSASASSTTICNGQSAILTLNGGGNGSVETIHWYSDSCTGTPVGTGNSFSVTPVTNTTYYGRYEDDAPCSYNTACVSIRINVDPVSVGGTVSPADTAICAGVNGGTLTLTGYTGGIVKWQSSSTSDFSSSVTDISNATSTLTYSNLTDTTYYRALITSGVCSSAYSSIARVAVSPAVVAGTAAATDHVVCEGGTTTLTLTGSTGSIEWQQSADKSSWSSITTGSGANTASYTTAALSSKTYYRAYIVSGTCTPAYSNIDSVAVNLNATISLTSGTASQTVCVNHTITDIVYTIGGAGTNATVTGLPAGVTGSYSSGVFTITGTPIDAGSFDYTVNTSGSSCTNNFASGTIQVNECNETVNMKLFVQGYYKGSSIMSPLLKLIGVSSNAADVDTVMLELRSSADLSHAAFATNGILQSNGQVSFTLPPGPFNKYFYLVVKLNNTLETWSADSVLIGATVTYDFTTGAGQAYGSNMIDLGDGNFAIYSGDINQDGTIDESDHTSLKSSTSSFLIGVHDVHDLNGDGAVDAGDLRIIQNNKGKGISVQHP